MINSRPRPDCADLPCFHSLGFPSCALTVGKNAGLALCRPLNLKLFQTRLNFLCACLPFLNIVKKKNSETCALCFSIRVSEEFLTFEGMLRATRDIANQLEVSSQTLHMQITEQLRKSLKQKRT